MARPEDLPPFDLEAAWTRIEAVIDDVAFGRSLGSAHASTQGNIQVALDSAHGDLADRLIVPMIGAYKADLDHTQGWRLEISRMHLNQRVQHLTERSLGVDNLRSRLADYYAERAEAWSVLGGASPSRPASFATPVQPIGVHPLPTLSSGDRSEGDGSQSATPLPRTSVSTGAADVQREVDANGAEVAA